MVKIKIIYLKVSIM